MRLLLAKKNLAKKKTNAITFRKSYAHVQRQHPRAKIVVGAVANQRMEQLEIRRVIAIKQT